MSFFKKTAANLGTLSLHVQPGAKRTEIVGLHGGALKIRLHAPPVDGKANQCLIGFLSAQLRLPKRNINLVSGETSRTKLISLEGITAEVEAQIMQWVTKY